MNRNGISRRSLIGFGALFGTSALLSAARAKAATGPDREHILIIRSWYFAWEHKDWSIPDRLLTDSFTFTSPVDDHISKQVFHDRCWPQAAHIKQFDLESVGASGDSDAFVKYLCHTTKGTSFRNIEYFRFADYRIAAIECYFGGGSGFPTASESGKS
jgi:ketosteroid isomerase-like protein